MKEIDAPIIDPTLELVREVRKTEVFKGSVLLRPGMSWWELDLTTMRIRKAELVNTRIEVVPLLSIFSGKKIGVTHRKMSDLKSQPNCWYDVAINWSNAKRKFLKRIKNETDKKKLEESRITQ